MASNLVLVLALILIVLGVLLLVQTRRRRAALRLPAGEVVYQDIQEERGTILYSQRYGLKGRLDLLLRQGDMIIPVEVKTGRTPRQPYLGHIMQLMAYCILVEDNYMVRPTHGVIRYQAQEFVIEFTPDREVALAGILAEMRDKHGFEEVHRSHTNPRVCASCGFREQCEERLDVEAPRLFP
jgi:CRISPR-associated exonuclease Cas4